MEKITDENDVRKHIAVQVVSKLLFLCYLSVVIYFAINLNTDKRLNWWDISEVIILLTFAIINSVLCGVSKQFSIYLFFCCVLPLIIIALKVPLFFMDLQAYNKLRISVGFLRMIELYLIVITNVLDFAEISVLFSKKEIRQNAIPTSEEKSMVNHLQVVRQPVRNTMGSNTGSKRNSFKSNNFSNLNIDPLRMSIINGENINFKEDGTVNKEGNPLLKLSNRPGPPFINVHDETNEGEGKIIYLDEGLSRIPNFTIIDEIDEFYGKSGGMNYKKSKYGVIFEELNRYSEPNFDVFSISKASDNQELLIVLNHMYKMYDFSSLNINLTTYRNYFHYINNGYRKNPYHNSIHATDVTQTVHYIFKTCDIKTKCQLSTMEVFTSFFAAAIHDLDHPGNNNMYEISIYSNIALSYNDKGVLENYHLYKAFLLLQDKDKDVNILKNFSTANYSRIRNMVINMVLSTDMAIHGLDLANFNSKIKSPDFAPNKQEYKDLLLNMIIHGSDVSNPTKPMNIYRNWIDGVFAEFFDQGDKEKEKGFPVSYLCDRVTVVPNDAQIGFIDFVVMPIFKALMIPFPEISKVIEVINENKETFKREKEQRMKELEKAKN